MGNRTEQTAATPWWKRSVVYQIYPRSFCDGNGDGIGDLRGIIGKLDHLQALGIDVVWLSPVYASPNDDNGYDISDYRAIMPEFGTMADFDEMLDGLHRRGIKLMMDLVVNHTSDEHDWFVQACRSCDNPYRDYYIWRAPREDGSEPNNWESAFGGSAWQFHEPTGEYYLHLFSKKQPDLNWDNPKVREEVYDLMHFWLRKGVDGFRMDVINMIAKTPGLPDAPVCDPSSRWQPAFTTAADEDRLLLYLREMKERVLSHYDIITVGETPTVTTRLGLALTHQETGALHMLFQFEHMDLDHQGSKWMGRELDLYELKRVTSRWQTELAVHGWNSLYLSNHDQPRPVSRFGDDEEYRVESAKLLATFLHLQQGTPFIYQGEELGMTNVRFDSIDDYRDIETLNMYRIAVHERGEDPQQVLSWIHAKSRDNARTPFQWDDSEHAGFSTVRPWIGVNPNYRYVNAAQALADPDSVFRYYRCLIELRKAHAILVDGRYDLLNDTPDEVFAFTRTLGEQRLLVALNFSPDTVPWRRPDRLELGPVLIGNLPDEPAVSDGVVSLRPYEARVWWVG
ncbi:glycoside hydrolase family 13 protein [Caldimonas brevitalea]|uniref:Oligo-1,6-glucosidase n=1 Tax=Caldimonas brevitalea TaxID=413882 RepID=A0A0G3BME7_9BURK|nr:alpha-glucosidase [Caldimonas brevitalea]AKJ29153.1 oligo-1,6-glucosidase [Caldimonas brevitalea]